MQAKWSTVSPSSSTAFQLAPLRIKKSKTGSWWKRGGRRRRGRWREEEGGRRREGGGGRIGAVKCGGGSEERRSIKSEVIGRGNSARREGWNGEQNELKERRE